MGFATFRSPTKINRSSIPVLKSSPAEGKTMSFGIHKIVLLLFLLPVLWLNAQENNATVKGFIRDAETSEPLVGVNVLVVGSGQGTASDQDGYYILQLAAGTYTIRFEMIGYRPYQKKQVVLRAGDRRTLNVYLVQQALEYGETVEVVGEKELSRSPVGSVMDVGRQEIRGRAGALEDVTRMLQTLPGVVSEGDFSGKMYVRGGRSDENVVLLDRIYIYEPYHLNGLTSIFNPDLIKDIEFYAGGFPAKYGQALSAVIEVYNRYGRRGPLQGNLSSSFISSTALLEGALPGPRGSFLLSARLNYYDKIMDMLRLPDSYFRPHFYDYQSKFFYPVNKKHLLEINALFSGDGLRWDIDPQDEFIDLPQGSRRFRRKQSLNMLSTDWKWVLSDNAFVHTNAAYTQQYFDARYVYPTSHWIHFNVGNYDLRSELTYLPAAHHKLESGLYLHMVKVDYRLSYPRAYWELFFSTNKNSSVRLSDDSTLIRADYASFYKYMGYYLQDQWEIIPGALITNVGVRLEYLDVSGQFVVNPRFNLIYHLDRHTLLKGAWGVFNQYSRDPLVFDPAAGNPRTRAPRATHYILGLERRFRKQFLFRVEGYYKELSDLVTTDSRTNYDNDGSGYSYGVDLFLQKKVSGKWSGWLSYSFGISRRKDSPAQPFYYPLQDQRHTFSLVANYRPRSSWNVGIKWLFHTGKPYTAIKSVQHLPDSLSGGIIVVPVEGPVNGERFPAYSRIDLRVNKNFVLFGKSCEGYLEIINLLNRKNVYDYHYNRDYSARKAIHQLPILPFMGMKFYF